MKSIQNTSDRDPYLWKQAKARVGFRMHLRSYLLVNAGLWVIWGLSSFTFGSSIHWTFPWPIFTMVSWGIGLASHYMHVYRGGNQRSLVEEEYQRLAAQQR